MFTYSRMKSKIAIILAILMLCSTWTSVFVSASPIESNFVEEAITALDEPENEALAPEESEPADNEPNNENTHEEDQEAGTDLSDSESEIETPDPGAEEPEEDLPPAEETEDVDLDNQFNVPAEVSGMEIVSNSIMMDPGTAQQFAVKFYDEDGQEVNAADGLQWEADPSIGQIDDNGRFTANNIIGQVQLRLCDSKIWRTICPSTRPGRKSRRCH